MKRQHSPFKDTALIDWESEPSLERSSSIFQDSEFVASPRRAQPRSGGLGIVFGGSLFIVLGLGYFALTWMQRALH